VSKFAKHKWIIITGLLLAPLIALAQAAPKMFTAGTVISSADVNANFSGLAARLTALEKALNAQRIPRVQPTGTVGAEYAAATSVRLPIYTVQVLESITEGSAACQVNDHVVSGGCWARDANTGTDSCVLERGYPVEDLVPSGTTGTNGWFCRTRKPGGPASECRVSAFAVCLKAN
jgi:hypothetical protein